MNSKQIIVLFFAFIALISCGKLSEQKETQQEVIVREKKDSLIYNLDVKLEILKKDIDSKNNPIYIVAITITNLSNDTFSISFDRDYIDELFDFEPQLIEANNYRGCDHFDFRMGFLLKHQKAIFQTTIRDPSQFWYLNMLQNIRIGYHLKRIKSNNKLIALDKEKQQVYWSNFVNLNTIIPSYHFYNQNTFFFDSLGNKAENYFRYDVSFKTDDYLNDMKEKMEKWYH